MEEKLVSITEAVSTILRRQAQYSLSDLLFYLIYLIYDAKLKFCVFVVEQLRL